MTADAGVAADPGGDADLLPLRTAADVIRTRHGVRDLATHCGFDLVSQTKLVTAVSELARNALEHGGGGRTSCRVVHSEGDTSRTGIEVVVEDDGPGIADLERAMTGGWSSASGLGLGLPGSQKLVHDFAIDTAPGRGTRIRIVMWRRGR